MIYVLISVVLQVILGILYANLLEWLMHKYVLHGLGKKPKNRFSFHWHVHHRLAVKNKFIDPEYKSWFWEKKTSRLAEVLSLAGLALIHSWVLFLAPWVYLGSFVWIFAYYFLHRKSHLDPAWAKKWLKWHYDHHMGTNQDQNWCVTMPFWDYILGTRMNYKYDEKTGKVVK